MTPIKFEPATRERIRLRMALVGPTGSGKTLGALEVATRIGNRVAGIDTEHGRMRLYADRFKFDHAELDDRSPEGYAAALRAAVAAGYDAVVVDSLSHEWLAVLEEADRFAQWNTLSPRHNAFVEAIAAADCHLIVTMRAKMKYAVSEVEEGGRKRQQIDRLGVGPVQRENLEYEFDVLGYLDSEHVATFSNRCDALVGKSMPVGEEVATILAEWLEEGDEPPEPEEADAELVSELLHLLQSEGFATEVIEAKFRLAASENRGVLAPAYVNEQLENAKTRLRQRAASATGEPAAEAEAEKPEAEPEEQRPAEEQPAEELQQAGQTGEPGPPPTFPVGDLTEAIIDKMSKREITPYLEHLNAPFEKQWPVADYRTALKTAIGIGAADVEPPAEETPAGDDPFAVEEPTPTVIENEEHAERVATLRRVLDYSEQQGERFTLGALQAKAQEHFGHPMEDVADLSVEEIENVLRAIPEEVRAAALEEAPA